MPEINPNNFYRRVLTLISNNNIPFLIGGGIAVKEYASIDRPVKDLDIFCKVVKNLNQ